MTTNEEEPSKIYRNENLEQKLAQCPLYGQLDLRDNTLNECDISIIV
jgi:hypothetical protein